MNKFIYQFAYTRTLILFVLLFIFNRQINHLLSLAGYKSNIVSYFPFLRALYAHLASTAGIGDVSTAYFHVLDVCLLMALAVWGTRLIAGLVFLRQYDDLYRRVLLGIAHVPRGRVCFLFMGGVLICLIPIFVTWVLMQPKTIDDPEIIFIVDWLPMAYFFALATMYFYCVGWFVELILFLFWKVFRQKRQSVGP